MNNDALKYFLAVVDSGSIQAAARNVVIAPSALSRQIKLLERDTGVILFERSSQGMSPTPAGRVLSDFAQRQQAETADLKRQLQQGLGNQLSEVKVASVEGVLPELLPRWLSKLRRRHQDVSFTVEAMASTDVAAAVACGDADVGYTFGRVARAELRELATFPMPIQLAVRRDHRFADTAVVAVGELEREVFVLPNSHFGIRREVDRECAKAGVQLATAYETDSLSFALTMVHLEGLVSFSTPCMLPAASPDVVLVDLAEPSFRTAHLSLVTRSAPSSALLGTLHHELSALMQADQSMESRP
ncbi:LysR family transcriptional regulator [Ornithinimicrobium faecis]|uniref:LysR family transcriptional regulator n=1 Tax=Ornithinimicrobium faecis TaxID=2934158 RepID=A0ABY4YR75_9MICO|nr:LysR family transcriptional regulator [Ornithinimicrobium sp. HY1793]USQ79208.1 LysR family transcriptional regulator [Ornithinimicrobium sp. HY1793]